jgi:hypothetical protein
MLDALTSAWAKGKGLVNVGRIALEDYPRYFKRLVIDKSGVGTMQPGFYEKAKDFLTKYKYPAMAAAVATPIISGMAGGQLARSMSSPAQEKKADWKEDIKNYFRAAYAAQKGVRVAGHVVNSAMEGLAKLNNPVIRGAIKYPQVSVPLALGTGLVALPFAAGYMGGRSPSQEKA